MQDTQRYSLIICRVFQAASIRKTLPLPNACIWGCKGNVSELNLNKDVSSCRAVLSIHMDQHPQWVILTWWTLDGCTNSINWTLSDNQIWTNTKSLMYKIFSFLQKHQWGNKNIGEERRKPNKENMNGNCMHFGSNLPSTKCISHAPIKVTLQID